MKATIFSFLLFFVLTLNFHVSGQSTEDPVLSTFDDLLGKWELTASSFNSTSAAAEESLETSAQPVLLIKEFFISEDSVGMGCELSAASKHAVSIKYSAKKDAWKVTTKRISRGEESPELRSIQSYIFKVFRQISDIELENDSQILISSKFGNLLFTRTQPMTRKELLEGDHKIEDGDLPPPPPLEETDAAEEHQEDSRGEDRAVDIRAKEGNLKSERRELAGADTPLPKGKINNNSLQNKSQHRRTLRTNMKEAIAEKAKAEKAKTEKAKTEKAKKDIGSSPLRRAKAIRSFEYATTTLQSRSGETVDGKNLPLTDALRESTLVLSNIKRRALVEKGRATLSLLVPLEGKSADEEEVLVFSAKIEYHTNATSSPSSTAESTSALADTPGRVGSKTPNKRNSLAAEHLRTTTESHGSEPASSFAIETSKKQAQVEDQVADQEVKLDVVVRSVTTLPRSTKFENVEIVENFLKNLHSIAVVNLPQVTGIPEAKGVLAEVSLISRNVADEEVVFTFLE